MIFTSRDRNALLLIVLVLIVGLSYLFGMPMISKWREAVTARERLERDMNFARKNLAKRPEYQERLGTLMNELPSYGTDEAVTAELLRRIERLARDNRVALTRNEAGNEEVIGDLHEVAINCAWESELEPLVRMLYAVQIQGATLDMRQLSINPVSGSQRLKGTFTIYFAFTRGTVDETGSEG